MDGHGDTLFWRRGDTFCKQIARSKLVDQNHHEERGRNGTQHNKYKNAPVKLTKNKQNAVNSTA